MKSLFALASLTYLEFVSNISYYLSSHDNVYDIVHYSYILDNVINILINIIMIR